MKRYAICVQGKRKKWGFFANAKPEQAEIWRQDGLDVSEVMGSVPPWIIRFGLLRPWLSYLEFRRPFVE